MRKRRAYRAPVQMTFEDRRRLTRAGKAKKRPGPKPGEFPNVRHRERALHKYWNPLHVTMRATRGLPSFRAETLYAAFERAVRRTRRDDFRIVEFSVQNDHLHMIVEADDKDALARGMKSFSVRANRLFNAALGRGRGRVWADRYHRRDLASARWFQGWIAIRRHDDGARPTEEGRTVLLREAWWRKHGFIHPGEVPKLA